jgi:hypothetical protein
VPYYLRLPITIIALRYYVRYYAYAPIALRYYAYCTYAPDIPAFRIRSIDCYPCAASCHGPVPDIGHVYHETLAY